MDWLVHFRGDASVSESATQVSMPVQQPVLIGQLEPSPGRGNRIAVGGEDSARNAYPGYGLLAIGTENGAIYVLKCEA